MKKLLTLVLSVMVTGASAQLKPVNYQDAGQQFHGFSVSPAAKGQRRAGILVLPAWKGIDTHAKETAAELGKLGYYVFVADIYGEGHYPKDTRSAGESAGYYKQHYTEYQHRIELALQQLVRAGADPDRIVVIGYCFGGTGAIEAARANFRVRGIVSFHGGLSRDTARAIIPIKPTLLILHGADDPSVPPAQLLAFEQELRTAGADWQLVSYSHAVHAFTDPDAGNDNSKGAAYNALAAKRSWKHFLVFLEEIFTG